MSAKPRVIILLFTLLLATATISAQVPTGKISGTVTDEQGNPLPGVSVEASSPKLVGRVTAFTDLNGAYRLFSLTPGTYRIAFSLDGFKTVVREGIIVQIEQTVELDVALPLGSIEEEVTVTGQSPLIDVKSTVKGMTLTKDMFEVLPRGRDFDTLVTAIPGGNN